MSEEVDIPDEEVAPEADEVTTEDDFGDPDSEDEEDTDDEEEDEDEDEDTEDVVT